MTSQFQVFAPGEVALPKLSRAGGFAPGPRGSKYPIDENFSVGATTFIPAKEGATDKESLAKLSKSVQSTLTRLAKQYNYRLTVRTLTEETSPWADENGTGIAGIGVWRIEGNYPTRASKKAA